MPHLPGTIFYIDDSGQTQPLVGVISDPVVIQTITVTLTNAQIKTLPSTPVQVIPAPGANRKFFIFGGLLVLDSTAGNYTTDSGAYLQLFYPDSEGGIHGAGEISGLMEFTNAGNSDIRSIIIPPLGTWNSSEGYIMTRFQGGKPVFENTPLVIADHYNGVADYGGGNEANTLKVTVYYAIIN